jgi:hypothetical protein
MKDPSAKSSFPGDHLTDEIGHVLSHQDFSAKTPLLWCILAKDAYIQIHMIEGRIFKKERTKPVFSVGKNQRFEMPTLRDHKPNDPNATKTKY